MRASRVARHVVVLFAFFFLPFANADATPILTSSGEPDLVGAGTSCRRPRQDTRASSDTSTVGTISLTRVDDFGGGLVDQWWSFAPGAEARALSMFAGNSFDFGFLDASSAFHNILSYDGGPGYLNFPAVPFASSEPLNRFALRTASGTVFNSAQAEDHMVTFQITGNTDQYGRDFSANIIGNYILGWEDLPFFMSDRPSCWHLDSQRWRTSGAAEADLQRKGSALASTISTGNFHSALHGVSSLT
jgi:hypothetical protein